MDYMNRALALAKEVLGTTSPNPAVGAVIVKDNQIVAEGGTRSPGQSHAEVVALQKAGQKAEGATLYITLEPCCFQGRTPACTRAIIDAGISRVCLAMLDPNPKVNGRGRNELEAAGVEVYIGSGQHEASEVYEGFAKHIKTGTPFVTAKYAMSLDGKIASRSGRSQWITGQHSRSLAHEWRKASDAIMVGINTVITDDARLTARGEDGTPFKHQPLRVVVDSHGRTPSQSRLFGELGNVLIATTSPEKSDVTRLQNAGAEVLQLPSYENMVDLKALLQHLGNRGVVNLLVEGGGALLGSLFDQGLVDKVLVFVSPIIIGGEYALSPIGGQGVDLLSEAFRLNDVNIGMSENDLLIKGYLT